MTDDEKDRVLNSLGEAITNAVDGTLVTHFVVLAEVVDDEGQKSFQSFTSDGLPMWSAVGMADLYATSKRHHAMFGDEDASS